jgi:hypothetical protein
MYIALHGSVVQLVHSFRKVAFSKAVGVNGSFDFQDKNGFREAVSAEAHRQIAK